VKSLEIQKHFCSGTELHMALEDKHTKLWPVSECIKDLHLPRAQPVKFGKFEDLRTT
jgi:hypothetical protein